jgi:hypothetical protein
MNKITFLFLLVATHSALFAQTQDQPKQIGIVQNMTFGVGLDFINTNNVRLNNPAFYFDLLYRSKSKSFMGGLESEHSFFYNGADRQRASNTPNYIYKSGEGVVGWYRVFKKEKTGSLGEQIYLGGGISSSFGTNTFDYTKWMAGIRWDDGQQFVRLGYRYYNFIGTENQNMVFLTIGSTIF